MGPFLHSYSTNFPLVENPISEYGAWKHLSPTNDESVVQTYSTGLGFNVAGPTMVGGSFNDSSAYLSGFSPNQSAQGVIWKSSSISGTSQEVEILLRWVDGLPEYTSPSYGNSTVRGYEINLNVNDGSYLNIGHFKVLPALLTVNPSSIIGRAPATGDVFKCTITTVGSTAVITAYLNGTQLAQATDPNPILVGNPGMGFFHNAGESNTQYGFSSFSATNL